MNKYFLLIGLLQLIPSVTPVDPLTTLLPLLFIFTGRWTKKNPTKKNNANNAKRPPPNAVSAIKEAADDIGRYHADRQANSRIFTVFRRGRATQVSIVAGCLCRRRPVVIARLRLSQVRSDELAVGDLLLLQDQLHSPCDVVLLWLFACVSCFGLRRCEFVSRARAGRVSTKAARTFK